jgi:hypothetical protein
VIDQFFPVAEVPVDRAGGNPGALGDAAYGEITIGAIREGSAGALEDVSVSRGRARYETPPGEAPTFLLL